MKRRALWFWTWTLVFASAGLVIVDPAMLALRRQNMLDPQIIAGILAVAAGVLAILFQRRSEFVATLRAEWSNCLRAIATVRVLYLRTTPSESDYLEAFSHLSIAIDGMRSVYRNHGESDRHVGHYPFATLHDIRLALTFDFGEGQLPDAAKRKRRLDQIDGFWRLFRRRFLAELETPEADRPILGRLEADVRQRGVDLWSSLFRRLPRQGRLLGPKDLEI